ncbi:hypothetical protein AVEN_132030-1 [Araneus ventricosus]|uniref:DUF4817 domain-containing protein n=1 Tax=Araneus ventricosus TaxID=182803 RepID=A0A4Y2VCH4_ARAVE|nr:hypothetical protein AVEN_132030-1 [Araneus ventricosus]
MTAGIVRTPRKLASSPNTTGRATLTKKARAVGVKSISLNERGWKFQSGIRTAIVFCLKERMGRSRIERVNVGLRSSHWGLGKEFDSHAETTQKTFYGRSSISR